MPLMRWLLATPQLDCLRTDSVSINSQAVVAAITYVIGRRKAGVAGNISGMSAQGTLLGPSSSHLDIHQFPVAVAPIVCHRHCVASHHVEVAGILVSRTASDTIPVGRNQVLVAASVHGDATRKAGVTNQIVGVSAQDTHPGGGVQDPVAVAPIVCHRQCVASHHVEVAWNLASRTASDTNPVGRNQVLVAASVHDDVTRKAGTNRSVGVPAQAAGPTAFAFTSGCAVVEPAAMIGVASGGIVADDKFITSRRIRDARTGNGVSRSVAALHTAAFFGGCRTQQDPVAAAPIICSRHHV